MTTLMRRLLHAAGAAAGYAIGVPLLAVICVIDDYDARRRTRQTRQPAGTMRYSHTGD